MNLVRSSTYVSVATSSSFALIIIFVMVPKERFMRGGAVMMRA